jgi:hypothetical protein
MTGYRAILIVIAVLAFGVAAGAGCASQVDLPPEAAEAGDDVVLVVEPAVPASVQGEFPDYVYRSPMALRGYQIAVTESEMLARLPCYCGCGQDPEYTSLLDCFLDPDGGFRSHGANCQVCLEQAEDAAQWKSEGLSTKEIRDRTDAEYEGRGPPTDTLPVLE